MLFYGRHRNRLLNWQRNRRDSPPGPAEYQEQSWPENRRARSQPSPCWQRPRFCPSLNYNRRLQASQAHHLDGRHLLASPSSIFRTTASTFFFFVILLPPAFQVLPQVQTVAEGAGFFFTASAVGLIEIPLSQSSHVMCELYRWTADINWWITEIMNQGRGESLLWELKAESETGSSSDQFLLSASQAEVVWI